MAWAADPDRAIARGAPLEGEAGLGTLTVSGFLDDVARRHAPRPAIVQHRDGRRECWSYDDLRNRAYEVARALAAGRLGKGERVGVLMTNRAEFLAAVFGIALAGGVAAPLSTFSTPAELDQLLAGAAFSVLLCEGQVLKKDFTTILAELEPALRTAAPGRLVSTRYPFLRRVVLADGASSCSAIEAWGDFIASGSGLPQGVIDARAAGISPADPGMLFFSSGSTGKPKGILSAHRAVAIQMWRMAAQQRLADGVTSWTANGFFWSGNFAMVVGGTLASGGTLVLQPTFEPEEALRLMAAERVSFLFAWPHQWEQLIAAESWARVDLSALRHVDVNSPITAHPTIRSDWIEPRHCYGNTETFTLSTAYPAGTSREEASDSHGVPLPGNTVRIVDPLSGRVLRPGERGEIAVKGPTLMLGYLGTPIDETLDADGFFRTGDGGFIDADGRLFWEGRLNDIIKTGGANVSPIEIDDVLRACPGVKVAQTVGVPHETLGELVVSCVVRHAAATLDEAAVRAHARERLASYKVPRRVLFFAEDALEMTGSAKVKTADLRGLATARLAQERDAEDVRMGADGR